VALELKEFLAAYSPKAICVPCLCAVSEREPADVNRAVEILVVASHADRQFGECFNCNIIRDVIRLR
jgi:hypothetical protein